MFAVGLLLIVAQSDFEKFLAPFAEKREAIGYIEATFNQVSVTPDETYESSGVIVFSRPRRMMMRYEDPEAVYFFSDEKALEYDRELAQLKIYDLKDMPEMEALFFGFDTEPKRLEEAYYVEVVTPGPETNGYPAIRLRPRTDQGREPLFETALLLLRKEDYLPHEVRIIHNEETRNTITVENIKIHPPGKTKKLVLFVPEGTTVIRDDRFVETVGEGGKTFPQEKTPPPPPALTSEDIVEP